MSLILLIIDFKSVEVRSFPPSAWVGSRFIQAAYQTDSTKSVPKKTRADRTGALRFFMENKINNKKCNGFIII